MTSRGQASLRCCLRRLLSLRLTSGLLTIQRFPRPASSPILPASFLLCPYEQQVFTHLGRRGEQASRGCSQKMSREWELVNAFLFFFSFFYKSAGCSLIFNLRTSTVGNEDGLAGKELLWVCLCEVAIRIL